MTEAALSEKEEEKPLSRLILYSLCEESSAEKEAQ